MNALKLIKAAIALYEAPSLATALALTEAVFEAVLPFIPHEQIAASLDDAARRRADAIADVAEDLKFPNG